MRRGHNGLLVIDFLGSIALAVCVLVSAWLSFVRADETSTNLRTLIGQVSAAQRDLASIGRIMAEQQARLTERRDHLDSTGQLPTRTPIELYSQEVLELAARHGLRVKRQNPVEARTYPGLLEQRYSYEMSGTTANILNFLVAIEESSFWADIAYLRLKDGGTSQQDKHDRRTASFTVSLFSAPNGGKLSEETG